MKKLVASLILLSLMAPLPALAASGPCQIERMLSELRAETDLLLTEHAYEVDTRLLFLELPLEPPAGTVVELEFLRGDRSLMREKITLITEDDATVTARREETDAAVAVIEVLATSPAQRAQLDDLLASGEVTVAVAIDGEPFTNLSLGDLVRRSQQLRETGPTPRAATVHLLDVGDDLQPVLAERTACEDNCYLQHDFCYDDCVWVPNSGPCFDSCDDALDECLMDCAGTCTPTTRTTTDVTLVSITPLGPVECKERQFVGKDWYIWSKLRYKKTVTTTTTHADCSQTVSTSVSYFNVYCWGLYAYNCTYVDFPTNNFC